MNRNRLMEKKTSRREFLVASSALAAMSLLPRRLIGGLGANEKIRVAHVGVGGMGESHLRWFAAFPDCETVALADVDQVRAAQKKELLGSLRPEVKVDTYSDFRDILDRSDIDVVTCATPDHWHAPVALAAFEAGKDVYGEKPLSYSVVEGRAMLAAQRKHKRVFQLGTQIHAGDNYHRVVELVQSGVLGKIHTVRLWKTGGAPNLGWPRNETPPATLDWDMWLGPAPYIDYTPARCHFSYRYFFDFSGGVFADFWCHIADVVFWALKPEGLTRVSARGEVPMDNIADTPLWIDVDFDFKGLKLHWTTNPPDIEWAKGRSIGAYFEGTEGSLICDYGDREISIGGETFKDLPEVPQSIPRSPGHQRNFLDAVRSRGVPESNLEYARGMTLPMHLALISFRLKRELNWDSERERFIGDPAADYMLHRDYRSPWSLPL